MNCIIISDDKSIKHSLETLVKEMNFLTLVKSCRSVVEAKEVLEEEKPCKRNSLFGNL